jgi:hypothetical protein
MRVYCTAQLSGQYPQFIQRATQVRRIAIDPKGPCSTQLVFSVPAAQQTDTQHPCTARRQEIPNRIAHHVTILHFHSQPLLASQEQIRLRFGPGHLPAFDYDRLRAKAKSRQRSIYLGASTRRGNAKSNPGLG